MARRAQYRTFDVLDKDFCTARWIWCWKHSCPTTPARVGSKARLSKRQADAWSLPASDVFTMMLSGPPTSPSPRSPLTLKASRMPTSETVPLLQEVLSGGRMMLHQ